MKLILTCITFLVSIHIHGQVFTEIIGADNPLNGFDVDTESDPSFADMDGDGDLDMISGENDGVFNYYKNIGTPTSPLFTEMSPGNNPLTGFDVGEDNKMELVDIDGDGDFDLFCGEEDGILNFFENTGTAYIPEFTQRTGASNPMRGEDVGRDSNPTFCDLDNDGDFDIIVGEDGGTMYYFENTGTATAPSFTRRTDEENPVAEFDIGDEAAPAFVDMDNDGDYDLVVADDGASFSYFENIGTASAPVFVERTGSANPLGSFTPDTAPTLTYVDIDGDGDSDQFSGGDDGKFRFYRGEGTGGNPSDITCNPCYSIANGNFGAGLTWSASSGGNPVTGTPSNDGSIEYIIENNYTVMVDGDYKVSHITVGNATGNGTLKWLGNHGVTFYHPNGVAVAENGTVDKNTYLDARLIFNQANHTYLIKNEGILDMGGFTVGLGETIQIEGAADIRVDQIKVIPASTAGNLGVTIWSEDFSSEGNNAFRGNDDNTNNNGADWTTTCPSCNRRNEFRVENNEFRVENTDEIATFLTEQIDLSSYINVKVNVDVDMNDNDFESNDCITLFSSTNLYGKTQFTTNGNLCGDGQDPTKASEDIADEAQNLEIIIEAITSSNNEDLHFDNIMVTGDEAQVIETVGTGAMHRNGDGGTLLVNTIDANSHPLSISNAGIIDLNTMMNCQPNQASFTQHTNAILKIGGTGIPLDADLTLYSSANNNQVHYDADNNQVIHPPSGNDYHHLFIANSGIKTSSHNLDIAGDLTISETAILSPLESVQIDLAGNWTNYGTVGFSEGTSTVNFDGNGNQVVNTILGTEHFYDVIFSVSGIKTLNPTLDVANDLSIANSAQAHPIQKTTTVGGNWTNYNPIGFIEGTGTVVFDGAAQQITNTSGSEEFHHLTFTNSGIKITTCALTVAQNLTISSDATLDCGGNTIAVGGDWINSSTGGFMARQAQVRFNGLGLQSITCSSIRLETFYDLFLDKDEGGMLRMYDDVHLVNTLNFPGTSGYLDINTHDLMISNWHDGHITGYDQNNFIIVDQTGLVRYTGIDAGEILNIPMALGPGPTNFALANLTMTDPGTGSLDANLCDYVNENGTCSNGSEVTDNAVDYTWNFISTSTNANTELYWHSSKELGAFDRSQSTVIHHSLGLWNKLSSFQPAQDESSFFGTGIYSQNGPTSSFSPFSIGSDRLIFLPVMLLQFKAQNTPSGTAINWSTATETDNDYFMVERSTDGLNYEHLYTVEAKGNSSTPTNYEYLDTKLQAGNAYYKLSQVDLDGQVSQLGIRVVQNQVTNKGVQGLNASVYPLPVTKGHPFTLTFHEEMSQDDLQISLINILGEKQSVEIRHTSPETHLIETRNLSSGVYFILARQHHHMWSKKIMIK